MRPMYSTYKACSMGYLCNDSPFGYFLNWRLHILPVAIAKAWINIITLIHHKTDCNVKWVALQYILYSDLRPWSRPKKKSRDNHRKKRVVKSQTAFWLDKSHPRILCRIQILHVFHNRIYITNYSILARTQARPYTICDISDWAWLISCK